MTLNGWRQPKGGRWRLEMPRLEGPTVLTCATIVAVLGGLAFGLFESVASWLAFLPVVGTMYSWPDVGQDEGNITGNRLADQIRQHIGLSTYSLPAARDATLAELLASNIPVFNAKAFGARGDNATDDTAALVAGHAAAEAVNGVLFIPIGIYRYSAKIFDIRDRVGIVGAGKRVTFLKALPTFSDYAITITNCWRNGTESAVAGSQALDIATSKAGVFLREFTICADRDEGPARGIATVGINDFIRIEDVDFCFLDGTALSLGATDEPGGQVGTVRECWFNGLMVSHCGNLSEPAVNISGGPGAAASDGANDLWFNDINLSNNRGTHLRIAAAKATASTRGIFINNWVVNGDGGEAASPSAADLVVIEGLVSCTLTNYMISGSADVAGTKYAAVRIKDNASGTPDRVLLDGDIVSMHGDGYVIDKLAGGIIRGTSGLGSGDCELRVASGGITSYLQYDVQSQQSIATRNAAIVIGDEASAFRMFGAFRDGTILTATDQDTTPDVKNCAVLFLNNTVATSITDFDNGGRGHVLTVVQANAGVETTLVHGASLLLKHAKDRVLQKNEIIQFVHSGSSSWTELDAMPLQSVDGFNQDNVAASQTNVELTRAVGRFRATSPGSVTGISVTSTEARTAGTLTVKVYKNTGLAGAAGAQLGTLTAVLDGTNTSKHAARQRAGLATYNAGDEVFITVTTDASWTPTTADIRCALEVVA